jgi:hypothetical protein
MNSRVFGLSFGALALTSACATTAVSRSGALNEAPSPEAYTHTLGRTEIDSMVAQAVADREGPRVTIRAEVVNVANSRRLRGAFHLEDDAYVLVGHVDADGVVRIVFPRDPKDDGFVKGGRGYETAEFFAGFEDAYRFRYATYGRFTGFQPNSYDASGGYLFIVASWRPMRFDQLTTNGAWDSFETTDSRYADPRPAIQELAALVAGENREQYTLEFARYYSTMNYTPLASSYNGFGLASCSGFGSMGWSPLVSWNMAMMLPAFYTMTSGDRFYYRGEPYVYDSLLDCAYRVPFNAGFGFFTALGGPFGPPRGTPSTPTTPRTHVMSIADSPRNPIEPRRPTVGRYAPSAPATPSDGNTETSGGLPVQVSAHYRDRGLFTPSDPRDEPARGPRAPGKPGVEFRTRPSIQEMTNHHTEDRGWATSRYGTNAPNTSDNGSSNPAPRARSRFGDDNGGLQTTRPIYGGGSNGGASNGGGRPDYGNQQMHSRPTPPDSPRSAPAAHFEPPRAASPAPVPAAPVAAPVSAPASNPTASSPGSSGSGAVGKPPV